MIAIRRVYALLLLLFVVVGVRSQMVRRVGLTTELESNLSPVTPIGGVDATMSWVINHWSLTGGVQTSSRYPNFFGALMAQASYTWDRSWGELDVTNHLGYRYHGANALSDFTYSLYAEWKGQHWNVALGNTFLFQGNKEVTEIFWLSPVIKARALLKRNDSAWNVALFAKNYDEFILRGFTMVYWGMDGYYHISDRWMAVAEASIRTMGNFSAASSFQGLIFKVGAVYTW